MAYAWTLFRSGRADSAVAHGRRALALEPLSPGLRHSLVALAIGARRYDLALREVRPTGGAGADPVSAVLEAYAQLLSGRAAQCADHDLGPWVALRAMCLRGNQISAERRRRGETRLVAGDKRVVARAQLADEYRQRPAIHHQMMRNDVQRMPAFTQPDKGETHQRRRGQLKRATNLRIAEIVQRRGRFSGFGKIHFRQRQRYIRVETLAAAVSGEAEAERFVPLPHSLQRLPERNPAQLAIEQER